MWSLYLLTSKFFMYSIVTVSPDSIISTILLKVLFVKTKKFLPISVTLSCYFLKWKDFNLEAKSGPGSSSPGCCDTVHVLTACFVAVPRCVSTKNQEVKMTSFLSLQDGRIAPGWLLGLWVNGVSRTLLGRAHLPIVPLTCSPTQSKIWCVKACGLFLHVSG